jgi:hypothetical protein
MSAGSEYAHEGCLQYCLTTIGNPPRLANFDNVLSGADRSRHLMRSIRYTAKTKHSGARFTGELTSLTPSEAWQPGVRDGG